MTQAGKACAVSNASMPEHYEDRLLLSGQFDRLIPGHDPFGSAQYPAELPTKPLGI
jgi:hypothetical protein